jgi:hypothetical protein
MKRIISFDIGIRNMAYCIFDIVISEPPTISEWTVLNVGQIETSQTNPQQQQQYKCSCRTKSKNKSQTVPPLCGKIAIFSDPNPDPNTKYYCRTHAKTSGFLLPKKTHEQSALKKLKAADLYTFLHPFLQNNTPTPHTPFTKKQDALDFAKTYFESHSLKLLEKPINKNVKEIDLLTIGRNIKTLFDQSAQMSEVTHVIIENQISPLANRMKTIQGMVAQYFIMKNSNIVIDFISSVNKLKGLVPTQPSNKIICRTNTPHPTTTTTTPTPPEVLQVNSIRLAEPVEAAAAVSSVSSESKSLKDKYKKHKSDAIDICRRFLTINPCLTHWSYAMDSRKKDDLADCFLQGIWYLKSRNIITYAENLKINSI